jgi:hypothetical protein
MGMEVNGEGNIRRRRGKAKERKRRVTGGEGTGRRRMEETMRNGAVDREERWYGRESKKMWMREGAYLRRWI